MTSNASNTTARTRPAPGRRGLRVLLLAALTVLALGASAVMAALFGVAIAYPRVPDVSALAHYSPKQPLRIYASDGTLIGEFGEERRNVTPIDQIPQVMKNAVLAAEDARFYEHGGVDYLGVLRAAIANIGHEKSQGASTITMQVARNVYLTSQKTYTRKLYELLLALKMEHSLSKDQILEIYMNQIYLGSRSYGFATAAQTYFDKPIQEVDVAEAAMLAGIPKAPSTANPIANFERAKRRQLYVLERMADNGFITREQAQEARQEELRISRGHVTSGSDARYVAEMARQVVYAQYGEQAYNRGLNVYTSIDSAEQAAAAAALRHGVLDYAASQRYRGPEETITLPDDAAQRAQLIDETLAATPDIASMEPAVVLSASAQKITAAVDHSEHVIEIKGSAGLRAVWSGLQSNAEAKIRVRPGAVIRVIHEKDDAWITAQLPEVEGALVALDPNTGAIKVLVGGFDFDQNEFNHVTQAYRQPGSSFKPFIYSASLEKGFMPSTIIDDGPLYFGPEVTGGKPWTPKNYGGGFKGPMSLMDGLAQSRNMVAIRVLQKITPQFGQQWIERFGFDADRNPAYLPLALGSGAATPLQLAAAYAVFANGGHRLEPYFITRITDQSGNVLVDTKPGVPDEANRVISARNAFIMNEMLQNVARRGTAARTQATLGRPDLYGKTGTTNDSQDAWFVGYQPKSLVAATWVGFDTPRSLGERNATGGALAMPIWINFMRSALKGVAVAANPEPPSGVSRMGGSWAYTEYARGGGITNLNGAGLIAQDMPDDEGLPMDYWATPPATSNSAADDERRRILELFRN